MKIIKQEWTRLADLFQHGLLIFLFLSGGYHTYGQYIDIRHYGMRDGLPSNTIYCMTEDHHGILWMGTKNGVVKYDGTNFKVYTTDDALHENEILSIQHIGEGRIMAMSFLNKFSIWDGNRFHFLENYCAKSNELDALLNHTPPLFASQIIPTNEGVIIQKLSHLPSYKDIILINGKKVENFYAHWRIPRQLNAIKIHEISKSQLFFYAFDTLDKKYKAFLISKGQLKEMKSPLVTFNNYGITINKSSIYVSSESNRIDLYHIDTTKNEIRKVKSIEAEHVVSGSIVIGEEVIVGNNKGRFSVYDLALNKKISNSIYTKFYGVNSIFHSRNGDIWIGTNDDGLYKLSKTSQFILDSSHGIENEKISYVYPLDSTRVLLGDIAGNVYETDGSKVRKVFEYYTKKHKSQRNEVRAIRVVGNYRIIVFNNDIVVLNQSNRLIHKYTLGSPKSIAVSHIDTIYIGTASNLFTLSNTRREGARMHREKTTALYISENKDMWIASSNNLYKYSFLNGEKKSFDKIHPIFKSNILTINGSEDGIIWVGTASNGIVGLRNDSVIIHLSKQNGFKSAFVSCIIPDKNALWIGTNNGVYKMTYILGKKSFVIRSLVNHNTNTGLKNDNITSIAIANNKLWMGSDQGLIVMDKSDFSRAETIHTVISSVAINNMDTTISQKYVLSHLQNNIAIGYIGVSYNHSGKLNYQYRIRGLNDQWITTQSIVKEIGPLVYGEYKFEVRCVDNQGIALGNTASIDIEILPAFYQTLWFRLLVVLIFLLLVFYYARYIINKAKEKNLQQFKQAELEMQAVRAQINPHFIFNCLSGIQYLTNQFDVKSANRYIARISHLIRQTLELSKSNTISLAEEIRYMENYLELEKMRFQDHLNYKIILGEGIDYDTTQIPSMLIQPYVENSIRHGIKYRKDHLGFVELKFQLVNEKIVCTIDDNGIGMKASRNLKIGHTIEYQSRGTESNAKRIESYNSITKNKITIEIIDKYDENNVALGTLVKLLIPLK